jgi:hypothetical protein
MKFPSPAYRNRPSGSRAILAPVQRLRLAQPRFPELNRRAKPTRYDSTPCFTLAAGRG